MGGQRFRSRQLPSSLPDQAIASPDEPLGSLSDCARRILVPFRLAAMRDELGCYATWFNEHRPHEALRGRTPLEVL